MIEEMPMRFGRRHPLWIPLFGEQASLRVADYRVDQSVAMISSSPEGAERLGRKVDDLLDRQDLNNASAALAEVRAYGGLLKAGFHVEPISASDTPTPDFLAELNSQMLVVEVAAKHQDRQQDELQGNIHDAIQGRKPLPQGIEHHVHDGTNAMIEMVVSTYQPGGAPDSEKPNDSVQANLISKICSIKDEERQIPEDLPAILIIDFCEFSAPASFGLLEQTALIIAGHYGFTSEAI